MILFSIFYEKFRVKRKKRKFRRQNNNPLPHSYLSDKNYVNTPPYGTPPSVGGFNDASYPGYPSN